MPRQQVVVQVTYTAPRVIVVAVLGPEGATTSETVFWGRDVYLSARRQAEAAWGGVEVDLDLRVSAPPWLAAGDLVRLADQALDPDDLGGSPYGQVAGFLPIGGVQVVQARAGLGILAPEDLAVVSSAQVDPPALAAIRERTGPTTPDVS